ncbi:hypothetical protein Tdes44962_MAKER05374 [Teratosphaeria destructans]|uniref:Rhodopsin domain-containing protein n=1 Tax=Teratosphaeria destructans TaxID=418781 RepID=A0A9W7SK85_9PEZI|nr:hypothetical protein Tdes44962_MAKER05374 [Teratosphaeria destructans]
MGSSTQPYHNPEFLREVWILYAIGLLVLGLRFAVRIRSVGFKGWQGDDYMAIVVIFCYTADAVTVTETYFKGSNVDFAATRIAVFSHGEQQHIIFGSKMQLIAWYTYTCLVWSLKACMVFFLNRLTFGLPVQKYVKVLAVWCVVTYTTVFLTITCSCHPIQLNWTVSPYPPRQCTLRAQNMYVTTILNVLTHGAMLAVPVPLLWKLNVPLKKKISMAVLLSSGVFVITAALVRIVMTLKSHPSALTINRWGVRETIAGIIAVNAPIIRPCESKHLQIASIVTPLTPGSVFSRSFWNGDFLKPESARRRTWPSSTRSSRTIGSASFHRPDLFQISGLSQTGLQNDHDKSAETSATYVNTLDSRTHSGQSREHEGYEKCNRLTMSRDSKATNARDLEEGIRPVLRDESVMPETTRNSSTSERDFCDDLIIRPPPPATLQQNRNRSSRFWHRNE